MKKILLIEDDQKVQAIYSEALQKASYETLSATNSEEAKHHLLSTHIDLVILDIMLPGEKNGFEILEDMKKDEKLKKIPSIVLTNLDTEKQIATNVGANDYLVKANTTLEQLLGKVKQIIGV